MSLVCKGRKFDSYEEVSQSMEHFQIENFFQMYIRDSKTIKSYLKRRPSREIKEDLRYVYLHYCCVHGGKKFESKSTGARPNTRYVVLFILLSNLSTYELRSLIDNTICHKKHLPSFLRWDLFIPIYLGTQDAQRLLSS